MKKIETGPVITVDSFDPETRGVHRRVNAHSDWRQWTYLKLNRANDVLILITDDSPEMPLTSISTRYLHYCFIREKRLPQFRTWEQARRTGIIIIIIQLKVLNYKQKVVRNR